MRQLKIEIEKQEIKSGYGGQSIEVVLNVIIDNENYLVTGTIVGIESGDMRIDVSDVILPKETTENTIAPNYVIDIVEEFYN